MELGQSLIHTVKHAPGIDRFKHTAQYRRFRHRLTLLLSPRRSRTFTQFMRVPTQYQALSGPVLDHVRCAGNEPLRVVVIGCSNGAESYSIAAALCQAHPALAFEVEGYDIDAALVEQARAGRYSTKQVCDNPRLPPWFVARTFDLERDGPYRVKPEVAEHVRFAPGDALDSSLADRIGQAPVVFAQNLLYHLRPRHAARAFHNIASLVATPGALFVDGMDLDLKPQLTRAAQLHPLDFEIEAIHREAEAGRGRFYPHLYFGLEPYMTVHADWRRRYATVFLRGAAPSRAPS